LRNECRSATSWHNLEVDDRIGPAWSEPGKEADWIAERLAPFNSHRVASVVPAGFDAYCRVLHPIETPERGGRLVRWAQVAAWSGTTIGRDSQFHSVALPPTRPETEAPWSGQGPRQGSLYPPDAEVLAETLRAFTTTPENCWFGIWDGFGWDHRVVLTAVVKKGITRRQRRAHQPLSRLPDPVPPAVRAGTRVRLPGRDYLLYAGPVEAIVAVIGIND